MKIAYLSLVLTFLMLIACSLLFFQARQDRKVTQTKLDQIESKLTPSSEKSEVTLVDEKAKIEAERDELAAKNMEIEKKLETMQAENEAIAKGSKEKLKQPSKQKAQPKALSALQKQIKDSPSIGDIQEYLKDEGFVIVNAGSDRRLQIGDEFALRREHYLVGKIKIAVVEKEQSIGNVVMDSIPLGLTIRPGDSVIMVPSSL